MKTTKYILDLPIKKELFNSFDEVINYLNTDIDKKISKKEIARMKKALKDYGSTRTGVHYCQYEYYILTIMSN